MNANSHCNKAIRIGLLLIVVFLVIAEPAQASGPFRPSYTLAEQRDRSKLLVRGKVLYSVPERTDRGFSGMSIVALTVIERDEEQELIPEQLIVVPFELTVDSKSTVKIPGYYAENHHRWGTSSKLTSAAFRYMVNAPDTDDPKRDQLLYAISHLESEDEQVANDAYTVLQGATIEELTQLREHFSHAKLKEWISTYNQDPVKDARIGLYGTMLGLIGSKNDIPLIEDWVLEKPKATDEFRYGVDGMMAGYLLLAGELGLRKIEAQKFRNLDAPSAEVYGAMQAIRFLWDHPDRPIPAARLIESMRILLPREDLQDLIINDLARMSDWDSMDKIVTLYRDNQGDDMKAIRRAIVRYLLIALKNDATPSEIATKAKESLEELEKIDPRTVESARRFFFD